MVIEFYIFGLERAHVCLGGWEGAPGGPWGIVRGPNYKGHFPSLALVDPLVDFQK